MTTATLPGGGASADRAPTVPVEDLSERGLMGLGERVFLALPVQVSALLIIVFSLALMGLGGLVEFAVISQLV